MSTLRGINESQPFFWTMHPPLSPNQTGLNESNFFKCHITRYTKLRSYATVQ